MILPREIMSIIETYSYYKKKIFFGRKLLGSQEAQSLLAELGYLKEEAIDACEKGKDYSEWMDRIHSILDCTVLDDKTSK